MRVRISAWGGASSPLAVTTPRIVPVGPEYGASPLGFTASLTSFGSTGNDEAMGAGSVALPTTTGSELDLPLQPSGVTEAAKAAKPTRPARAGVSRAGFVSAISRA